MRVAPSPFARVMPERRSLFCLLKLVRVFLVFEAPRLLAGLATGAGGCPTPHNPCCSEDVAMRYDFSPLYRSTVGFDRLLDVPRPGDPRRADGQLAALQHREIGRRPVPDHHGPCRLRARGDPAYSAGDHASHHGPEAPRARGRGGPAPGPRDPRLQAELRSRRSREGRGRQPRQRTPDHRAEARGSRGVEAAPDRDRLERWTEACWPGERSPDRPGRGGVSAEAPKSPTPRTAKPAGKGDARQLRGGRTNGCERSDPLGPQPQLGPEHGPLR